MRLGSCPPTLLPAIHLSFGRAGARPDPSLTLKPCLPARKPFPGQAGLHQRCALPLWPARRSFSAGGMPSSKGGRLLEAVVGVHFIFSTAPGVCTYFG